MGQGTPNKINRWTSMQTKRLFGILALGLGLAPLLALLLALHTARAGAAGFPRYVATSGRDAIPLGGGFFVPNDCLDGGDPCRTVQHAIDEAVPDDQVRVATGVYIGVRARDGMTQVVYINKSVTIRGGYTTTNWSASFPLTQPTTLDAQGLGRVVVITGSITPTLDGFIVTHGDAVGQVANCPSGNGAPAGCGGGIFVYAASPAIVNNIITNNVAATAAVSPTGYGGGLYLRYADGAVISGNVIISNAGRLGGMGSGGGIYLYQSNAQVRANQILNNYATLQDANAWGGGILVWYGAPTVENNVLRGNWVKPSGTLYSGAALYLWNDSGTYSGNQIAENHGESAVILNRSQSRFESNRVISNSTAIGMELFNGPGAGPTLVNNIVARSGTMIIRAQGQSGQALTATLIHNTLVGPGAGSGVYVAGYTTLFMTNTIAVSATWGITNVSPASATVNADHNLFWANTYPGIQGTNPVSGNPRFINPAAGDYHVGAGSAAIDAGVNAGVTTDVDGDPRPIGPAPDVGADEARFVYLPLVLRNY
jgi:putative cofactor-binding repeat protein